MGKIFEQDAIDEISERLEETMRKIAREEIKAAAPKKSPAKTS